MVNLSKNNNHKIKYLHFTEDEKPAKYYNAQMLNSLIT